MDLIVGVRVESFVKSLPYTERMKCTHTIGLLLENGSHLGMPYSKKIHPRLWELRIRGEHEIRLIYGVVKGKYCLVHGFVKKSNKTPKKEMKTALNRLDTLK